MAFPTVALLIAAIPPLIGRLFKSGMSQADIQKYVIKLLSAQGISATANDIMKFFYQSPAYSQVQGLAMSAGRQAESRAASIGAGMGVTSGMDVIGRAVAAGVGSGTLANIVGQRSTLAQGEALQQNTALANALISGGPAPQYSREMLGSSLSFLGPLLSDWLREKYRIPRAPREPGRTAQPDPWSY